MVLCALLRLRVSFLRVSFSGHILVQSAAMGFKNTIPDRWTEYVPVGRRIPGTRFIAFKVPLSDKYDNKLDPCKRFSSSHLIEEVEKQKEELGLVVDLTCTMRYYSPEELPQTVMYSKILTVGHEVPSDDVITQFKSTVKQYLSQNSENDKLVGVHCTHGLNRTGYLVCRYLIDLLSMEPSEAIEKFNSSRGHSIERSNYINDLLHGKCRSNAELDKPQNNLLSGRNFNSRSPPCSEQPRQTHGFAGLHKFQAKHQHVSRKDGNSGPPPYLEEQPRSHGHTYDTPRLGPRSGHPSLHQQPGQVMRLRRWVPHSGGRDFSHGPRMPPSGVPYPHMTGPRHSLQQMEANQPRYFREPIGHRQQPQRPFPQHYDAVNGASPQDCRPRFSARNDGNAGNCSPSQPPRTHLRFDDECNPYQWYPEPDRRRKPPKQWQ